MPYSIPLFLYPYCASSTILYALEGKTKLSQSYVITSVLGTKLAFNNVAHWKNNDFACTISLHSTMNI